MTFCGIMDPKKKKNPSAFGDLLSTGSSLLGPHGWIAKDNHISTVHFVFGDFLYCSTKRAVRMQMKKLVLTSTSSTFYKSPKCRKKNT